MSFNYTPYLFDEFNDVADLADADNKKQELLNGRAYNILTKGIPSKLEFSVKKLGDISEKLKTGYSNTVRNKNGGGIINIR